MEVGNTEIKMFIVYLVLLHCNTRKFSKKDADSYPILSCVRQTMMEREFYAQQTDL